MWYKLQGTSEHNPELADAMIELLQSTLRTLIYVTGGLCALLYIIANASALHNDIVGISYVLLAIAIPSWIAHQLLTRHLVAAQIIWLSGLTLAISVAVAIFQRAEFGLLLILIPLIGSVTLGWIGGLGAELAITLLAWIGSTQPLVAGLWPGFIPTLLFGGVMTAALGWASTRTLLTVNKWALYNYQHARQEMEEAREQRVELNQVQQDLILSNQELARLSNRLRAMQHITEAAKRAKEEFVANVSHELRTPLNMIIGFSEMIMQSPQLYGGNLPQPLLADIAAIQRNSQHLSKLVNDVLDLSQTDADQMTISKEWVDVREILDDACQAVDALFKSKQLYLARHFSESVPLLLCDQTRIRQVIINLLSNAGRFTDRGGVTATVRHQNGEILVAISDTGPGIAPEDQERLFQPFQQVDASIRRKHGGSGLGLAISKRFIEMHGGKIWLESNVDVGTTITFSLPIEPPLSMLETYGDSAQRWFHPFDEHTYNVRTYPPKAPAPAPTPRYVLVDESGALQPLLNRHIPDAETVTFSTIEQAITALRQSPAQALIINAPPTREMAARLQPLEDLPYETPAITCWVPPQDDAFKRLGAIDYLIKPVTREQLLSTLATVADEIKTVLLVDDDPEVLRLFSRIIASSDQQYRILQAPNGHRALALMRERKPDMILLDLVMPEISGLDTLMRKQEDPEIRDIPVVILSSMDPRGAFSIGASLTVTSGQHLTAQNLVACVQGLSRLLSPQSEREASSGR